VSLSIRKSVDPSDEFELAKEVDAIAPHQGGQDGRLIIVEEARPLRDRSGDA